MCRIAGTDRWLSAIRVAKDLRAKRAAVDAAERARKSWRTQIDNRRVEPIESMKEIA